MLAGTPACTRHVCTGLQLATVGWPSHVLEVARVFLASCSYSVSSLTINQDPMDWVRNMPQCSYFEIVGDSVLSKTRQDVWRL